MNWIERLYEVQRLGRKDFYSQNGEGIYLEYIVDSLYESSVCFSLGAIIDIGGGDGFYLSNTRQVSKFTGKKVHVFDRQNGYSVGVDNVLQLFTDPGLISIDIDGNDYWVLNRILTKFKPAIIVAEFNAHYQDSRTIKYDDQFQWQGDSYYGFTFEAGKKLAEKHSYTVIFQNDNMNMYFLRNDLVNVPVPPVTYEPQSYFKMSERTDWVMI